MSQADARSLMTGRIVDSYSNILTLKLFSHNSREEAYAKDAMSQFLDTVHPQMRLVTQLNGAVWIINMLLIAAITGLGIYLWINDSVSPGAVAVGVSLAIRLTGMSHWVMWEVSGLFESIGTVQDGINTIALAQTVSDVDIPQTLTHCTGAIAFQSVYFGYNRAAPLFEDFNLQIASGERVGIVGRSGAGKSTLTNLLLRFYALERGTITIDGVDISDLSQQQLRSHIGVVTQDTSLLHRSVGDNILFGAPASTPEQVRAAAVKAEAHDFIMTLRDSDGGSGYDSQVGERGVSLSGGQRQRIAIARVILKNAPILVLDEATSALDSEVEALIQGSLDKLMDGKTVIAIAHRLSTIAAMDRLLVIDRGAIVEQGSHRQLIAANGLYARLWQHQSGGFIGEE
ncbi:MAG: ATP-binding cassette subfamily B multidrug efflux pump [Paraglaciecola psychrophila]|jgi:ATP-binding cassette subfamily B multidrug efflux pump